MAELHLSKSGLPGLAIQIGRKPFLIGRDVGCDLCLPENIISRQHACIECGEQGHQLKNLSKHGTLVDSLPIDKIVLTDGVDFQIGPWRFVFKESSLLDEKKRRDMNTVITELKKESPTRLIRLNPDTHHFEIQNPVLTEWLSLVYLFYLPLVIIAPLHFYFRHRDLFKKITNRDLKEISGLDYDRYKKITENNSCCHTGYTG